MKEKLSRLAQLVRFNKAAINKAAVGAGVLALTAGAHAQSTTATFTLDPTQVVTAISNGVTVISAIGMAILSMAVVIKLFKWVQRVL